MAAMPATAGNIQQTRVTDNGEAAGRGLMVKNIEGLPQFGKDHLDATMKAFGSVSKSMQAISAEMVDYTKKAFEQGTAATEKLLSAKSFDKVFEVQSDYARTAYEGFVAEATKLGELYADLAKQACRPFESRWSKAGSST
jgi:hypothetical protein